MKQKLYILTTFALLLEALLLTACQRDVLLPEQEDISQPEVRWTDSCYVNLHIVNTIPGQFSSIPAVKPTRATAIEENAVYDGILCVFVGANEIDATLKTATVIDQLINNPGTSSTIDVTQRLAIGTHAYNNNLYVLALLNTTAAGFRVSGTTLQFKNTADPSSTYANIPDANSDGIITISDIQALQIGSVGSPDKHVGLFMSNAIQDGGGRMPLITTTGNSKQLYDTEDDARALTANHLVIRVERASARVKVTNDIPTATTLSNITLVGATTTHPLIHKMSWAVKNYNDGSYAVGNGATDKGVPTNTFATGDFTTFHQHSLLSGDEVYIGENYNNSKTQVVVEVQLKDGSFLLGDCFNYNNENSLYTTTDALINYFKEYNWNVEKGNYPDIENESKEEVFRNAKVTVNSDGSVKVTLTNSSFNSTEQAALSSYATALSNLTKCFRDGKMYYTYTLDDLVRNNAYNLNLVENSVSPQMATVVFSFNLGSEGQTATSINNSLFSASGVTHGSNLEIRDANNGQTRFYPILAADMEPSANNDNAIDFTITPITGLTFTPTSVSFHTTRFGTDNGKVDVSWINSDDTAVTLEKGIKPARNNNVTIWKGSLSTNASNGPCGLRLNLYNLANDKQVGFSDIVITGIVSGANANSISGVGQPTP